MKLYCRRCKGPMPSVRCYHRPSHPNTEGLHQSTHHAWLRCICNIHNSATWGPGMCTGPHSAQNLPPLPAHAHTLPHLHPPSTPLAGPGCQGLQAQEVIHSSCHSLPCRCHAERHVYLPQETVLQLRVASSTWVCAQVAVWRPACCHAHEANSSNHTALCPAA